MEPVTIATTVLGAARGLRDLFGGSDVSIPDTAPVFDNTRAMLLGKDYADFLRTRLSTPIAETDQYRRMRTALDEQLARVSRRARHRAGDVAQARGFADSGVLLDQFGDIDRAELEAFSSGLRDIMEYLETERTAGVLPFLTAASSEELASKGLLKELSIAQENLRLEERQSGVDALLNFFELGREGGPFAGMWE